MQERQEEVGVMRGKGLGFWLRVGHPTNLLVSPSLPFQQSSRNRSILVAELEAPTTNPARKC